MAEIRTESNCTDSFASNKNNVLIAMGSTSAVSLIMCLVAVSLVLWLKVYNIFTYRLALYQVLSSFSLTLALVLSLMLIDYDEESLYYKVACKTDAFLLQYTATVKLLFTICLNFHIFSLAVCLKNFRKLELCYIFFSCFTPLMTSWIPFIGDFYGLAGAWCWIKTWKHNCASHHYTQGILEQFLLWYGPLFLSLTASVISVFVVILVLLHQSYGYCRKSVPEREQLLEKEERKKMRNALRDLLPLLAYPLLFYVLTLLPLVNRIYSSISPHPSYWWAFAHSVSEGLWGFFSGSALILHIFLTRRFIKRKPQKCSVVNYAESDVFTTKGTEAYVAPSESKIDCVSE